MIINKITKAYRKAVPKARIHHFILNRLRQKKITDLIDIVLC